MTISEDRLRQVLDRLLKDTVYSESTLRLHLLLFSFTTHPSNGDLYEYRMGYYLDPDVLEQLVDDDDLPIAELGNDDFKTFLRLQLSGFLERVRQIEPNDMGHWDFLSELEFEGSEEAIVISEEPDGRKKATIDNARISPGLRSRLIDYDIRSLGYRLQTSWPQKIVDKLVECIVPSERCRIYCFDAGIGDIVVKLSERYRDLSPVYEVDVDTHLEKWLCEVNLFANNLEDTKIGYIDDRFERIVESLEEHKSSTDSEELKELIRWDIIFDLFDIGIGIAEPYDRIIDNVDKDLFAWCYGTKGFENAAVELMYRVLKNDGHAAIAVPQGFLFAKNSQTLRERLLNFNVIDCVEDVDAGKASSVQDVSSILLVRRNRTKTSVSFSGDSDEYEQVEKAREEILGTDDFDIRPSAHSRKNSLEYRYREIEDIFRLGYLDEGLRNVFRKIRSALEEGNLEGLLNPCRKIIEATSIRLFEKMNATVPRFVYTNKNGGINLANAIKLLNGDEVWIKPQKHSLSKRILPAHVGDCLIFSKALADKDSHLYADLVGKFAYEAAVLALFEFLIWFKGYMDKNTN